MSKKEVILGGCYHSGLAYALGYYVSDEVELDDQLFTNLHGGAMAALAEHRRQFDPSRDIERFIVALSPVSIIRDIQVGDFVFCNGEGIAIFPVESVDNKSKTAYLGPAVHDIGTGGNEDLRSLTLVQDSEHANRFPEFCETFLDSEKYDGAENNAGCDCCGEEDRVEGDKFCDGCINHDICEYCFERLDDCGCDYDDDNSCDKEYCFGCDCCDHEDEFCEEFVVDTFRPMNAFARARWLMAQKKGN